VELQVARLRDRLAERRITLDVTPAAAEWLAFEGYDPAYGARPLRRLGQRAIGDELARLMRGGEVADGATVTVDRGPGGGLVLAAAAGASAPSAVSAVCGTLPPPSRGTDPAPGKGEILLPAGSGGP